MEGRTKKLFSRIVNITDYCTGDVMFQELHGRQIKIGEIVFR